MKCLGQDEDAMKQSQGQHDEKHETPARRPWVRPVLVEYGHLAKLTRGGSGLVNETGGKKKCL